MLCVGNWVSPCSKSFRYRLRREEEARSYYSLNLPRHRSVHVYSEGAEELCFCTAVSLFCLLSTVGVAASYSGFWTDPLGTTSQSHLLPPAQVCLLTLTKKTEETSRLTRNLALLISDTRLPAKLIFESCPVPTCVSSFCNSKPWNLTAGSSQLGRFLLRLKQVLHSAGSDQSAVFRNFSVILVVNI